MVPSLHATLAQEILDETAKTSVAAITCPLCKCTVYSRSRHDFRSCQCGAVSIDGGFDYVKCAWDTERVGMPKSFELKVDATKKEMYDDWNSGRDRYGLIQDVGGNPVAARTKRPRTRRAPTVNRKPAAPRRKNTRVRA